jgi:RNA polymerase sigma-70 factor (ECF subfamily)
VGFVLAAAARLTGDLDEAEECAQDAYTQALARWADTGVPAQPGAWLTTVARRRTMDLLRRRDLARAKLPLLGLDAATGGEPAAPVEAIDGDEVGCVPDDRLRLVFTCCHPALGSDARVMPRLRQR